MNSDWKIINVRKNYSYQKILDELIDEPNKKYLISTYIGQEGRYLHQDLYRRALDMKMLNEFDFNRTYGPCNTISRLERIDRAIRLDISTVECEKVLALLHAYPYDPWYQFSHVDLNEGFNRGSQLAMACIRDAWYKSKS